MTKIENNWFNSHRIRCTFRPSHLITYIENSGFFAPPLLSREWFAWTPSSRVQPYTSQNRRTSNRAIDFLDFLPAYRTFGKSADQFFVYSPRSFVHRVQYMWMYGILECSAAESEKWRPFFRLAPLVRPPDQGNARGDFVLFLFFLGMESLRIILLREFYTITNFNRSDVVYTFIFNSYIHTYTQRHMFQFSNSMSRESHGMCEPPMRVDNFFCS